MKKTIVTLAFTVVIASTVFAQQNRSSQVDPKNGDKNREMTTQEMVDRIERKVDLTEKQKAALLEFFEETKAQREQTRLQAQQEREKRRAENEAVRNEQSRKLEQILGKQKYEELTDTRNSSGLTPKEKADRVAEKYGLSEQQRDNLEKYYRKNREDREAIRQQERTKREEFQKKQDRELEEIIGKEKMDEIRHSRERYNNRPVDAIENDQAMDETFDEMEELFGRRGEAREAIGAIIDEMEDKGGATIDMLMKTMREKGPAIREFMEEMGSELERIFEDGPGNNETTGNGKNTSYSIL